MKKDFLSGAIADICQEAAGDLFVQGVTVNSDGVLRRLAETVGHSPPFTDGLALAESLAHAVRKMSDADLGLAVHGVAEQGQNVENLGRGETYIALSGDGVAASRQVHSAGRGRPDRRRAAVHALSVLRRALLSLQ